MSLYVALSSLYVLGRRWNSNDEIAPEAIDLEEMAKSLSKPLRLIKVRTYDIEEFSADKTPAYAILSHTWQEEKEVTYAEFKKDVDGEKAGYEKIRAACKQAKKDGHEYLWIDTCCIDKDSQSELSESINSMFAWYQNATVCYALFSDVLQGCLDENGNERSLLNQCQTARWFTRGWCLQELLAPTSIKFFAQDWTLIGSLDEMVGGGFQSVWYTGAGLEARKEAVRLQHCAKALVGCQ